MEPHASPLVTYGMAALALAVLATVVAAIARTRAPGAPLAIGIALAWLLLSGALAHSGFLADFAARPPRFAAVLVPTIALPLLLARSRIGAQLARETPLWLLIGFHAFRLPLELVMHAAAAEGTMPPQMTFAAGYNLDIVTGATAIATAAYLAWRGPSRRLALAWNAVGSALLLVIVAIALASIPTIAAFGPHALNTWIAYLPFVWLPAILVAAALLGHLLLWRRLLALPRR